MHTHWSDDDDDGWAAQHVNRHTQKAYTRICPTSWGRRRCRRRRLRRERHRTILIYKHARELMCRRFFVGGPGAERAQHNTRRVCCVQCFGGF